MKQGARLDLRRVDGQVVQSQLASYGVRVERGPDGEVVYRGDPRDAEIILMLPAEIRDDDVSPGTEIWLR